MRFLARCRMVAGFAARVEGSGVMCYAARRREGIMDWMDCKVIEQVEGRLSGVPVVKHSRVRPEDILNNLDLSEEEIAEDFDLRLEDVREVLAFWRWNKDQLPSGA